MAEVERAIGRLVDAVDRGDYSQSLAEREGEGSALLLQVPEVQHRLVQRAEHYGKVTCLSRKIALQ